MTDIDVFLCDLHFANDISTKFNIVAKWNCLKRYESERKIMKGLIEVNLKVIPEENC